MGKMGMKKTKKYPPVASKAHSAISKTRDRDIPISSDHFEDFNTLRRGDLLAIGRPRKVSVD